MSGLQGCSPPTDLQRLPRLGRGSQQMVIPEARKDFQITFEVVDRTIREPGAGAALRHAPGQHGIRRAIMREIVVGTVNEADRWASKGILDELGEYESVLVDIEVELDT